MKDLIRKREIREAIRSVAPVKVAVAYLGANSTEYVGVGPRTEGVIVRPTTGTNPDEVFRIADLIGWGKVHLLTSLHAKIYLGKTGVVFGSCNLSYNGLGDHGLHEIAVFSDATDTVGRISRYFDELVKLAEQEFPTEDLKKDVINRLKSKGPVTIHEAALSTSAIPIIWYGSEILGYKKEGLERYGVASTDEFNSFICEDAIGITNRCAIRPGQHVITWKARGNGTVVKSSVKWVYAHRIESDFNDDPAYTTLLFQLLDEAPPLPPFAINDKFRSTFASLMDQMPGDFILKNQEKTPWEVDTDVYDESRRFLGKVASTLATR